MTKDEALKMALEALEDVQEMMNTSDWFNERVQAVRQALDQLPDTTKMIDTGIDRGAWSDVPDATKWVDELRGDEPDLLNQTCCECGKSGGYALYCGECWGKATKREWVGLTDEQIEAIHQSTWMQSTATLNDFARAIEAAHGIKEKNT